MTTKPQKRVAEPADGVGDYPKGKRKIFSHGGRQWVGGPGAFLNFEFLTEWKKEVFSDGVISPRTW